MRTSPRRVRPLRRRWPGLHPGHSVPRPASAGVSAAVPSRVADPTCRSQSFGPSVLVSGSAYPLLRLSALECLTSLADGGPTMPSADSCTAVGSPRGSPSSEIGTRRRPPQVNSIAFAAPLPDLQPWPLMDMDFAVSCPLVRPGMPRIRFLFVRSRFCSALPSDPTSR
jgi:hypothetical protein